MSKRTLWITAGAIAIATVAIAIALAWILIPRANPEDQARAYLRALADGDLAAVQATGLQVRATTASAFAEASDYLSEGTIESATADEYTSAVIVSYELAGTRHKSTLTFSQRDGRWVPDAVTSIGSVQFTAPTAISDTLLPPERALLLPAVYELSASPTEFLDGSASIEVLPGSTEDVDLEATLRPDAADSAQAQLDEYLVDCTQPAAEAPPSCGISIPWAADFSAVSEIRYKIEQAPVIALTATKFQADGGVLVATVTGTALDGSTKTLTYRSTNWSVRGDVTFTSDDIVLSVW